MDSTSSLRSANAFTLIEALADLIGLKCIALYELLHQTINRHLFRTDNLASSLQLRADDLVRSFFYSVQKILTRGLIWLAGMNWSESAHTKLPDHSSGNLLIVVSSLLYGTYIVISKDLFQRYGALNVITWMFIVGAVVTIPVGAYSLGNEHFRLAGTGVWLAVVFVILFPTVGAYYLNAWALTKVTPSTVAVYIYLQPLIAFGLAPFLLGESWNSRTIAAALLIFAGVGVVTRRGRSQAVKEIKKHPDALAH